MSVHPTQTEPPSAPVGVERVAETVLPTKYGVFRMLGYRDSGGTEHVALVRGDDGGGAPLVRVHSECLTGDAFGSWRCDCGEQLDAALAAISVEERGVVVYVRGHEGRGIGLLAKLKAYALQDQGVDTVDANTELGLPVDARKYDQAAGILRDLGIGAIRLLSGNPAKEEALEALGIAVVERRGLAVSERTENARYLRTKRARMRHDSTVGLDVWASLLDGVAPDLPEDDLVRRYGYLAAASVPIVVGHARQSLDGFVAPRPHSPALPQEPSDEGHVQRLRALVDAVLVGASTVLAEDHTLLVDEVPGDTPVRVVLDAAGMLPANSRVLTDDAAPTLWLVAQDVDVPSTLAASVEVVRLPADAVGPAEVLDLLRQRGLDRVLVEGGGATVSGFLEAGLLHRLYCTTVPVLIGDGVPGLRFSGARAPVQIRTAPVRRFVLGHDTCSEFDFTVSQ